MKKLLCNKKYSGIFWSIIIAFLFIGISSGVNRVLHGNHWYLFSSLIRVVFGLIILFVGKKLYGRSIKDMIGFEQYEAALIAGLGFIIYLVYYVIDVCSGIKAITGLSMGILISHLVLQQLTTGFYEELNYRFLILEGFFYGKNSIRNKIIYAFLSFLVFGAVHTIDGWDTDVFLLTGTIGFAFAVMYIKSRNIIIPMIFHFIYDVFANLTIYIEWNDSALFVMINSVFEIMLVVMFLVSFIMLINKEKLRGANCEKNEKISFFDRIHIERESVCMGDDCNAPNAKELEYEVDEYLSDFMETVARYVPSMKLVV